MYLLIYKPNLCLSRKASDYFLKFPEKMSILFRNVFVAIDLVNNGMDLRDNITYMKDIIFNGYN